MKKKDKIFKIVASSAILLASVVMVVLSIVNLVNKGKGASEMFAFQIIASVIFISASLISTILAISRDPRHFDMKLVVSNGTLLGLGIFIILPAASDVANSIVGVLIPSVVLGVGVFFIIASIVSLIKKINQKSTDIFGIMIGVLMVVASIVLLVYSDKATRIMWLIIGALLLVYSVSELIKAIKIKPESKPIEGNVKPSDKKN